jgi:hypothetical protein
MKGRLGGRLREVWQFRYYFLSAAVAVILWDTLMMKPFRIFIVMVHEVCHAAATLMTGGEVLEIRTNWNESGHTLSRGGFFPLITAAGYVGSAMLGALLIYTGTAPRIQRVVLLAIGAATMLMTMGYTPAGEADFFLGIFGGLIIVSLAIKSSRAAMIGSTWLGTLLCLYSMYDFRTDLWMHPELTDAGILARGVGLPQIMAYPIALSWVVISVVLMYRAMRALVRWQRQQS